jgi:hypothetical protein
MINEASDLIKIGLKLNETEYMHELGYLAHKKENN